MAAENFGDFAIHLHQTDDVAVTKRQLKRGVELVNGSIHLTAAQNIPPGHKVAVHEIPDGAPVRKYGQIIGFANGRIAAGDHVHLHNLAVKDFGRDYEFCAEARPVNYYSPEKMRAFQGYSRPNGRAGRSCRRAGHRERRRGGGPAGGPRAPDRRRRWKA